MPEISTTIGRHRNDSAEKDMVIEAFGSKGAPLLTVLF
jgi:hypothetical protein